MYPGAQAKIRPQQFSLTSPAPRATPSSQAGARFEQVVAGCVQLILHLAMALRGHVVLDPGRDGRRFVWQIGLTIRFLNKRLAHQILRSSGNAAIGSYLGPSNPPRGWGHWFIYLVDLKSVRERPSIRNHLRSATEFPRRFHKRMSPQTAEAATR